MTELRVLTVEDWARWREVRLQALAEAPHAFRTTFAAWQHATEAQWRQRLTEVEYNLIAELDGRPAGMLSGMRPDAEGAVRLRSMWVAPFARGRGVGDALVGAVIRWAKEQGASGLVLDVMMDNESAIALYRRHGFVPDGTVEHGRWVQRVMVRHGTQPAL